MERCLDDLAEFGKRLIGRVLPVAPLKASQDGFCFGGTQMQRRRILDHLVVLLLNQRLAT